MLQLDICIFIHLCESDAVNCHSQAAVVEPMQESDASKVHHVERYFMALCLKIGILPSLIESDSCMTGRRS